MDASKQAADSCGARTPVSARASFGALSGVSYVSVRGARRVQQQYQNVSGVHEESERQGVLHLRWVRW